MQRNANPDGYAANLTAWQTAFNSAAVAGRLPGGNRTILESSNDLLEAFTSPQQGRPTGLGTVLDDSVRSGKLVDERDFLTSEQSIYHRSWLPSPWAVFQWSLRQVGVNLGGSYDVAGGRLKAGKLVLIQALETLTKDIMATQSKRSQGLPDRVMSREDFVNEFLTPATSDSASCTKQDLEVLLRHLSRDLAVLSYDATTIKFRSPTSSRPDPITPEDASIAQLKTLISTLQQQTESLQTRITTLQNTAQTALKQQPPQKGLALSSLRSKKLAERTLSTRLATLSQLEETYTSIETASDQIAIVAAMRDSASVLRILNAQTGGVDEVDKVMDDLREQIGAADEIGGVLREPVDQKMAGVDVEMEVDEEFERMEAEERNVLEAYVEKERREREEKEAEETRRRLAELEEKRPEQSEIREATKPLNQVEIEGATVQ